MVMMMMMMIIIIVCRIFIIFKQQHGLARVGSNGIDHLNMSSHAVS